MPQRDIRYDKSYIYEPGLSTLMAWPLLGILATAVHLFIRSAILHAEIQSAESYVVIATGLMSLVMCVWLDRLGKKSREAAEAAKKYKFWGFAVVVMGIGVSLLVHYVTIGLEKRQAQMSKAVTLNTAGVERTQNLFQDQLARHGNCTERFQNMRSKDKKGVTVLDFCGAAPVVPASKVVTDATTGLLDFVLYESMALGLLAVLCIVDVIIYAHGLMTVSGIAEGAYQRSKKRAPVELGSTVSLPDYHGD